MIDGIARGLDLLHRRLSLMVGRGRIEIGDDSGSVQMLQVQQNQQAIRDSLPRIMEWGFSSSPLPGAQSLILYIAGERSNGVVCGTNDERHRLKNLQPGEVAIYDDQGQSIKITRNGIVIDGGGLPLTIVNCPSIKHDGTEIGKLHKHGGVQTGGGTTGTPV